MDYIDRERIMKRWDVWRKYISEGGNASWPRDEFEILLDIYDDIINGLERQINHESKK